MVAVRTGFPSPMQPMGSFPPMALPAGQTPVPAPVPPMPLAGFPPPPVKSPMAQQVSNAPRRRRFGDSLEGMLGRNIFSTQQQRPMPTPMMPRPMEMGGAVQYFANGGNANQQAAASMLSAGIGNVGGKAITSGAQSIQDRFSDASSRRKRRRRKRKARQEAARLAAEQAAAEQAALAASSAAVPEAFVPPSGGIGAAPSGFGYTPPGALPASNVTPEVPVESGFMNIEQPDRSIDREIAGGTFDDDPAFTGALPPAPYVGPEVGYFGDAVRIDEGKVAPPVPFSPSPINLGTASPDDIQPDVGPGFSKSSFGQVDLGRPGDRGFTPSGTQIAPEAATAFEMTPEEQAIVGGMSAVPAAGSAVTPEELNIMSGMSAVPDAGQKIAPPKAGTGGSDRDDKSDPRLKLIPKGEDGKPVVDLDVLRNTGLLEIYLENLANPDERLNRTPQVPGAAQTQLLTDAFNMASKDPNFLEQVIGKVVKNLTFGTFDPNERNRAQAQAILDAYKETGTFAYDSEKDALDLSDTPEGLANFEKLQEMSAGDGQEIGTIGVYDAEGNIVGNKNTYVNTKDGVVVENIFDKLSSGDDGGSDTGTDTGVDTGHTVDEDGNIVCNTEGYVYNPETKICELPKEEEVDTTPGSGIGTGTSGESFEDVLKRVVVAAPDVAPISANAQPMQEGGMAGLNRAADNFLQALAG